MADGSGDDLPLLYAYIPILRYGMQHYYRTVSPYTELSNQGLAHAVLVDERDPREVVENALLSSDVAQFLLPRDQVQLRMFQGLTGLPHTKGHWSPRPLVIADYDDYDEAISPLNPAFAGLGTYNPVDGSRLVEGQAINVQTRDGEQTLWDDKETKSGYMTFDVERNKAIIDTMYQVARTADGVTVTCEQLAQVFRERGCRNVFVSPNALPWDQWTQLRPLVPRTDGKVRIIWQGGSNHLPDWIPLAEALGSVLRKYPQAMLVWWGDPFKQVMEHIPETQLEYRSWTNCHGYVPWRGHMDCDINLCPLEDTPFNRAKSAIKWYEASALPRPEATLARNIPPFDEIEDGVTGLLYDTPQEFAEKLGTLIENATLRQTLGEGAKEWVRQNRSTAVTAPRLLNFYAETRDRVRAQASAPRVKSATPADLERLLSST